jgi:FixJ family two-component response regulator
VSLAGDSFVTQVHDRPAWFVGDLADPWVSGIAERLPLTILRRGFAGELPEAWIAEEPPPGLVVLHRPLVTSLDAQRISRLRARGDSAARVILCAGPHSRYDDLLRWSRLFDVVLPEATASETIRRWVDPQPRTVGSCPLVKIVSGIYDVRSLLNDVCLASGFAVECFDDRHDLQPTGLTIWDVPVLDPTWPDRLARHAKTANVVALLGFADRENVRKARQAGAVACLEWPCDLDDLVYVLDRAVNELSTEKSVTQRAHFVPPAPLLARRTQRNNDVVEPRRSS